VLGDERVVLEDLFHERADLLAPVGAGGVLQDAAALRGELLQVLAHGLVSSVLLRHAQKVDHTKRPPI